MPARSIVLVVALSLVAGVGCKKSNSEAKAESPAADQQQTDSDRSRATDKPARPNFGQVGGASRFDKNGDGVLDESERATIYSSRAARVMKRLDRDGNGDISKDELRSGPGPMGRLLGDFDIIDGNKDGVINADEVKEALKKRRVLRPQRPGSTSTDSAKKPQRP